MKTLIVLLSLALMGFSNPPESTSGIYYYYNFEDTYNGCLIIAYANSEEEAHDLITDELLLIGLTFYPGNVVEYIAMKSDKEAFVILVNSGDL
jgi:hypothetical protein